MLGLEGVGDVRFDRFAQRLSGGLLVSSRIVNRRKVAPRSVLGGTFPPGTLIGCTFIALAPIRFTTPLRSVLLIDLARGFDPMVFVPPLWTALPLPDFMGADADAVIPGHGQSSVGL